MRTSVESFAAGATIIGLAVAAPLRAQGGTREAAVRQTVQAFYDAFNSHAFDRVPEITTDDWNHINPLGGRTRGRAAVLAELHEVHSTFLKDVTDTILEMDVRFATDDVAVATVSSQLTTFTTPDGVKHENERLTHTFILVRRGGRWLIMQDHNTFVTQPPAG
ncbi:MAG TPA: SgcJ/EcaC family oxidoreductase [Gemmatimonadaceae bacterium]|nr:SgcJ/EcaC family oxidoreductase [Gemmatimonadaceae bacterium]